MYLSAKKVSPKGGDKAVTMVTKFKNGRIINPFHTTNRLFSLFLSPLSPFVTKKW
jgi:hypothetical protein